MLGGYQILDLRNIGLTLSASAKTITDADILGQLRNLREYIEKGHDYSKPLNNSPKCVLIRYRDAKNGEKCEVCEFASITSSNNSLTYEIKSKGFMIELVFEEKTDDDGNKYYDIKTAKYIYSHDESVEGDLSVGGDVEITGDASIGGDLEVTGDASIGGDLEVTGDADFKDDIKLNGESALRTFNGNISSNVTSLGLTVVASFVKVVRNFNELQFIFNCRLQNATESAITITSDTSIANFNVDDNGIQSKIYAHDGQSCVYDVEVSRGSIAMATLFLSQTTGLALEHKNVNLYHAGGNFNFYLEGGFIEIASNGVIDLEARISLAL